MGVPGTSAQSEQSTAASVDRPPRVTRRRAMTRARLIDAAFEVFAAQGFGQTSIEGVCEAAGYTRGAFYSNFESLDELFFALYEQRSDLLAAQVAEALAEPVERETTASLVERIVAALMIDRDWILVKTEFFLYAARTPAAAATLTSHRTKLHNVLARLLSSAVDRTGLPPSLRTPEGLATAVMAVHDGAMTRLLLDPIDESFNTWVAELLTALVDHPSPTSGGKNHATTSGAANQSKLG
jgi:AcrR family transcriptional regulator